eukprot:s62_g37.t1
MPSKLIWPAFNSILQGDHCGVDIATEAHTQLLRSVGLLQPGIQLTANQPCRHPSRVEGLVIDDFFSVSVEETSNNPEDAAAVHAYHTAQKAYERAGLLGSPEKDKCGAEEGKTIGAFLNSAQRATSRGLCTVSAPPEKRLALSTISVQVAQLGATTCGLHSCIMGAWVSMIIYRRPMMSLFQQAFTLVSNEQAAERNNEVIHLPRAVAQELAMVSILSPLMQTNLAACYGQRIYATDASEEKGAICSAPASKDIQEVLFRTCRTKGAYTKLLSPTQVLLKRLNEFEEIGEETFQLPFVRPGRPLAFTFEFLEIYSGASDVTRYMDSFGIICGQPIELSRSEEFNMKFVHLLEWITYMLAEKVLKAVLLMPPCTTFSIMRRPALRDRFHPFGFNPQDPQTMDGNILAQRSFQVGKVAAVNAAIAVIEKPHTSKMKYLPSWEDLLSLPSASQVRSDSCQFGSIHRKSFSFLSINLDLSPIALRCKGTCSHIPVQGKYTKASATYEPRLAYGLAHCLAHGVFQMRSACHDVDRIEVEGLERPLVNEVVLTSSWEVEKCWSFKSPSHINLLELKSVEKLVQRKAQTTRSERFVSVVDSNVSRGALGKGRSSSLAVSGVLRRINATLLASDLYMVNPFCPTRLNVSDDPTRDTPLRSPVPGLDAHELTRDQLFDLASLPRLRRWASNWARLCILLCFPKILHLSDRSIYRQSSANSLRVGFSKSPVLDFSVLDFDHTLGYPGEGPEDLAKVGLVLFGFCFLFSPLPCFLLVAFHFLPARVPGLGQLCCACFWIAVCSGSFFQRAEAMELGPFSGLERRKAEMRAARPALPVDRPTLEVTCRLREKYWDMFLKWTQAEGIDMPGLLQSYLLYVDEINSVLVKYGRALYNAGKPYSVYAETINMLSAKKPVLRRQLQGAWDLAFSWIKAEPSSHHIAMPWQVLLAMVTVAVTWGWTEVAGCLSLAWGALLRAGEILSATRHELLLPRDVGETIHYALLSIGEPKTRQTGPRHQAAKLDIPDLLSVVDLAFGDLPELCRLWPRTGQTLRLRFREILQELGLPTSRYNNMKPLDLGSLRSGGCTWHLQVTENAEYCRRKGRWLSSKVMEIYIQETTALLYLKKITTDSRDKVLAVASLFPAILARAQKLKDANVPTKTWFSLLHQEDLWRKWG